MKLRFLYVIGLVILLMPLATATLAAPSTQVVICEQEYVVQADDWLSKLADRFYGDMFAFTLIVIATNGQADEKYADIENPDSIEPGWVLCIPPATDSGESMEPAAAGTEIIQFTPTTIPLDPNQQPLQMTACQPSQVIPRPGVYQCTSANGSSLDPCWVVEGNALLCSPGWLPPQFEEPPSYSLATAPETLPEIDPASAESGPVAFFLALEGNNPPCRKRVDLAMVLAGQPVTYSCEAPGAWLVGELDTSQPTWLAQRVITDPSGVNVTDGPTAVGVQKAWVYGAVEEEAAQPAQAERTQVWADNVTVEVVDGQYVATLNGHFPDSCSTLGGVETTVEGDTINVTVYAERPSDLMCASALVAFETTFTLDVGELEPGEYTVVVNESATTT